MTLTGKGLQPLTRTEAPESLLSATTITIGADTDANGSGVIDLQTRGVTRLTIGNTGMIGIGGTATSFLDISSGSALGGNRFVRFNNKESGHPDYGIEIHHTLNTEFGFVRPIHSLVFGYNYTTSGNVEFENDEAIALVIETPYMTSEGNKQSELYFQTRAPTTEGGASYRPFGFDHLFENDTLLGSMRFDSMRIGHKGSIYDWMSFDSTATSGDLSIYGNAGISFTGTAPFGGSVKPVIITYAGGNILYAMEDLSGNKRLKFFDGSGGAAGSDYLNIFAATDADQTVNQVLMFGNTASAGKNRSIRWNGTDQRFEYQDTDLSSVTAFRKFNDWASHIRHYGVTRSLGDDAGDYIELGSVTLTGNGDGFFQIEVFSDDLRTFKLFNIPKSDGDSSGTWREVQPAISGPAITDGGDVAVDIRNAGTGGHNLRLRRTVATVYGAQTYTVALRIFDKINSFVAASGSGASATVAGDYRWIPWTMTPSGPALWDGSTIQPITIGATDTGGSGYRALVVPN